MSSSTALKSLEKPALKDCEYYRLSIHYPESFRKFERIKSAHKIYDGTPRLIEAYSELTDEELNHYLLVQYFSTSSDVLRELRRRYNEKKDECEELRGAHNDVLQRLENKKKECEALEVLKKELTVLRKKFPRLTDWEWLFRISSGN